MDFSKNFSPEQRAEEPAHRPLRQLLARSLQPSHRETQPPLNLGVRLRETRLGRRRSLRPERSLWRPRTPRYTLESRPKRLHKRGAVFAADDGLRHVPPNLALVPAAPLRVTNAPLSVFWLATDDNPKESFGPDSGAAPGALSFNENHYQAMLADVRRTQGYIEAIKQRLAKNTPGTMTVLDLGTGPYAVLAFAAARAGAKKVYCHPFASV